MDGLPLVLYLTLLLYPVLSFIPAPVNLKVISNNFQHVLHWDPGPGTPAGTQYRVIWRLSGRVKERLSNSMTTSLNLTLPPLKEAFLTVQASYNQTLSERSSKISFTPFSQTTIGPPKVTLAGCGYCIHLNISLPEVDRSLRIKDIKAIYHDVQFEIFWSKHKGAMQSAITRNNSYTVNNLQIGTEYCVQVYIRINTNRNNVPSALNCTLTSVVEPSRDPVFVGAVAALLIGIGALMSLMFCLYYTGFLCKMKETLPGVLEALSQGYTLTPERTAPDNISIGAETEQQRMRHNPPAPQAATTDTDEEEEEEEGENVYMNRDAELSSVLMLAFQFSLLSMETPRNLYSFTMSTSSPRTLSGCGAVVLLPKSTTISLVLATFRSR
ncbi:interferon alpha/beta receptor 2-like isoform X2 [Cebidichthys violaceus]|uniref:interferon alpha/beta receptor 2-like isoform X2 n=1 Tax=Cebidichthys violaceus TaxID=271503 RepID=UPI0035C94681